MALFHPKAARILCFGHVLPQIDRPQNIFFQSDLINNKKCYLCNMSQHEINRIILDHLKLYNPQFIGLFGSYARAEQTSKSDMDILVSFSEAISLLTLIRIENELTEKLGIKVDIITEGAIKNKRVYKEILNDLQIIYKA